MKKQMLAILDGEGSSDGNIASTPEDVSTSSPPAFTEIPYPGYHLTNTIHHDTYPTIDPTKADLTGKIVFISGASQGLGKAMAMSFARSGASGIIIAARSMNLLDEVAIAMTEAAALVNRSPKILKLMLDVTDIATVENVAAEIRRVFGKLDVVINNAGRADNPQAVPLSMSDPDDWWNVWTVNIRGVYLVTRALLPLLTNNDADNKLIVNIASYVAHFASPLSSAYCIGKFALLRLTETIHLECAPHNISVLSVHPGVVLTDMTKDIPALMRSTLIDSPQLSADTLVWLAKERRDWLSGRYISSTWDMTELESMKEDITTGDKLKMRMVI
ncbi:hypothetical protein SERLA73DRAFT_188929 [Serpula lacrymans var. lacrymans S7.3]|uniref:Uncharacterized protein n=2 Tax=Serpula lacrymans var. lacrymans TaxID=341189 RepID=F8QCG0_SERL3|nr:uncharacterized protein SERLADRAFT_479540 [Serpula lacrymans var. lacrymans S7.9]EGN93825.1 hypothetical protein SERLA73DRAFT_188929 [Serpula lacrymans var. lacrymans S7.3]EGO19193.1 hypothetical protein SERLADRAFT_479540 [Serpula lacrymans var. lacrymans S7.9]